MDHTYNELVTFAMTFHYCYCFYELKKCIFRFVKFAICRQHQKAFHFFKKALRFFRSKGFLRILIDFVSETTGFLPKVHKIFWSEMSLGQLSVSKPIVSIRGRHTVQKQKSVVHCLITKFYNPLFYKLRLLSNILQHKTSVHCFIA